MIDQKGIEYIVCDRGDGLGFDLLNSLVNLKMEYQSTNL